MPIRIKIAAASTVAALVLLIGAGLIFLTTLRSGLQNSLDNSLRSRADEIATQINPDGSIKATTSSRVRLTDNSYGQVLKPDGTVLQSTTDDLRTPLLTSGQLVSIPAGGRFQNVVITSSALGEHRQDLRVLAVSTGSGGLIIAVGASRDVVDEAIERAGKQLLILGAVVLAIAAIGSWFLAGSALRPVDRMRAQAEELEAHDAGTGLTVPKSRDEIRRLALTFNALLDRLHSALTREQAFVADAGHELRTPLTVLRGELELGMRPGRSAADLQATIAIAADETERLIRLAEDLLALARDDNAAELRSASIDLRSLLSDAVELLTAPASARSVAIELTAEPGLAVDGDAARLRQAIDNVLTNAIRHARSSVAISGALTDGRVTVVVTDDGPGFTADVLPVAFDRFTRADTARSRDDQPGDFGPGSGLGLAIVRSVLRRHRGEAAAANRSDGPGAVVTLTWPARQLPSIARTAAAAPTATRPPES